MLTVIDITNYCIKQHVLGYIGEVLPCSNVYGGRELSFVKIYFKYEMRKRNEILMIKAIWKLRQIYFQIKCHYFHIKFKLRFKKRLRLFSVLKAKLKLKFSRWPSVIIYRALSFLRWCASCSSNTMYYLKKTALVLQRDLYQHRT